MALTIAKCCFCHLSLLLICFTPLACAVYQEQGCKTLLHNPPVQIDKHSAEGYCLGCPDVILVCSPKYPELAGSHVIQPNGCIALVRTGGVRLEGLTTEQASATLASLLQANKDDVQVAVTEYRHQEVYVFGEVLGLRSAIPYQGPETVTDILRRAGGLTRNSAPAHVRVIRNSPISGKAPHVYQIDLQAILLRGDSSTDLPVQPNDQIYVPESQEGRFSKCFHPLIQSIRHWFLSRSEPALRSS